MKNKQNRLKILVNRYKNEQKGSLKELSVKVTEMLYINKPFLVLALHNTTCTYKKHNINGAIVILALKDSFHKLVFIVHCLM